MKIVCITIVSLLLFCACLKDEPFKGEYSGYEPVAISDEWSISTPEQESIERAKLEQAFRLLYSDQRFLMARSMLVIRNGKLVAEAYPHDISDRDEYANIQSCTKSFTSIMMGISIQSGVDISVEDKLFNIYPDLFDEDIRKREIVIKDALKMQTGLEFNNDNNTLQLYQTKSNSTRFVLAFPYRNDPGTIMNYNDGAPHLVSKAIEIKTGKTLGEYAREKLFEPLNITEWRWESAKDGTTFGAFSLYLKPRDFAKVGQLLLQNGMWLNEQLIDTSYLSLATSQQVTSPGNKPYGLYFWIDEKNHGFYAHGHGGQILLVIPPKKLVLLYTAWPYTSGDFFDDAFELFDMIVEGCE
ncbi:MAG: class C beta-lactamase-related serine hydrolase [Bacteroidales bacterium]|nr:MAG: class C beta-lactamase-related serine hydrolase [Bacteroidales bacterium]